jgi:hypothetical protein
MIVQKALGQLILLTKYEPDATSCASFHVTIKHGLCGK